MEFNQTVRTGYDEHIYMLKAMFYLLTPNETFYEKREDVPDLTGKASKYFLGLILIEQIIFIIKNGRFNGRLSDGITSISAGMVTSLPNLFFNSLSVISYDWVYKNMNVYDLPWDSIGTYFIAFLLVDMMYYWFHRVAHEVNIFWAAHQVHHSSEEYNLTTALRQSVAQNYIGSWIFYMPLAILIRPSIFLVHKHMNLLYQFWIHTEVVKSLGPLEYILNTPSHHRVHHGRNPYCIDKNYAGVLIIWDRIFGTFEPEKSDEELAYGLVHPIETFDPIYVQMFNYKYLFQKFLSAPTLSHKFSVLFKGPGWMPGTGRLGNHEDLPKIEYPIIKKGAAMPIFLNIYVAINFSFLSLIFAEFVGKTNQFPVIVTSVFAALIIFNLTCYGMYFDAKSYALGFDFIRLILHNILIFKTETTLIYLLSSNTLVQIYKVYNIYSIIAVFCLLVFNLRDYITMRIEKSKKVIKTYPEYDLVKRRHQQFHMKMSMKHQTINCENDPNFKSF